MYGHNRKLSMFCYDKLGAQASANLFSLVMTARANGVEPFEYLSELFERLPSATTVEEIEALLPWNLISSSPPHQSIVVAGTVQPATYGPV
jgi:transposase